MTTDGDLTDDKLAGLLHDLREEFPLLGDVDATGDGRWSSDVLDHARTLRRAVADELRARKEPVVRPWPWSIRLTAARGGLRDLVRDRPAR